MLVHLLFTVKSQIPNRLLHSITDSLPLHCLHFRISAWRNPASVTTSYAPNIHYIHTPINSKVSINQSIPHPSKKAASKYNATIYTHIRVVEWDITWRPAAHAIRIEANQNFLSLRRSFTWNFLVSIAKSKTLTLGMCAQIDPILIGIRIQHLADVGS